MNTKAKTGIGFALGLALGAGGAATLSAPKAAPRNPAAIVSYAGGATTFRLKPVHGVSEVFTLSADGALQDEQGKEIAGAAVDKAKAAAKAAQDGLAAFAGAL